MAAQTWTVEVQRTITTTVEITADSAEDAYEAVEDASYPLPAVEDWQPLDGWDIRVLSDSGEVVAGDE